MDKKIEAFNTHADAYKERLMDYDRYYDTFHVFCDLLPSKKCSILELGCGPGNVTRFLMQTLPELQILATDIAPNMLEIAKKYNPNTTFKQMDCRDLLSLNRMFDAIVAAFVMPFLTNDECESLIKDAGKCLPKGGMFYFSTMEDESERNGFEKTSFSGADMVYFNYHQERHLANALQNNEFELLHTYRKDYVEMDGSITIDMVMIARKL